MPHLRLLLIPVLALLGAAIQAEELPAEIRLGSGGLASLERPYGTGLLGWVGEKRLIEAEFAHDPVKISWQVIKGAGPGVNEAFANRQIDVALYGDFSAIIGRAAGIETTILLGAGRGSASYLTVPTGSTAKSITDLVGKRIGIHKGRPFELAFANLIAANGLKYTDFRIFNLTPQDGLSALSAGSIDALYGTDGPLAEISHSGRNIWSTTEADPHWSFTAEIFAATDFVRKYPAATQRLVNVLVKAAAEVSKEQNRDAYLDFFARAGSTPDVVRRHWAGIALIERNNPLLDPFLREHYRRAAAFAKDRGLIRREVPDLDGWFEPRFLTTALTTLGLASHWPSVAADGANFRHRLPQ
jgi:sulfonate transport system substrate-binding protein